MCNNNFIKLASLNVQSIITFLSTIHSLAAYIKRYDIDIMFLQETWISSHNSLKYKFKDTSIQESHIIISDHTTQSHHSYKGNGTALIVHKGWTPYIKDTFRIPGRLTGILIAQFNKTYLILNIYNPSNIALSKSVTEGVRNIIRTHPNALLILMGDFNFVSDPVLDKLPPPAKYVVTPPSPLSRYIIKRLKLVDTWRIRHTQEKAYTFKTDHYQSRIDMTFISPELLPSIVQVRINPNVIIRNSLNHSIIECSIRFPINRLESKYGSSFQPNRIIFEFHKATPERIVSYNSDVNDQIALKNNKDIQDILYKASKSNIPFRTASQFKTNSPQIISLNKMSKSLLSMNKILKGNHNEISLKTHHIIDRYYKFWNDKDLRSDTPLIHIKHKIHYI